MEYIVYILFSKKDTRLYVGCTNNLDNRIKRHNLGHVTATKNRRPLIVLYSESFTDKSEAFNRERYLKSLWSSRFKRKLRQQYINNVFQNNEIQ